MDTAEALPEKPKCPSLETRQDFLQEATTFIAQHYEKINKNKVQGPSINVFRNKHQKPKSSKYMPLEIKKKETLDVDVFQEHRAALQHICPPKERSKSRHSEESLQGQTSFKEAHCYRLKEKCWPMDLIARGEI
ncbi:IQ domain-containing protein M [Cavia porcellus]|uniref:IQ domain-containing protein M n=1 Tax=Cavia porcellus TaxID=10141 RepID=UPI002FE2949D